MRALVLLLLLLGWILFSEFRWRSRFGRSELLSQRMHTVQEQLAYCEVTLSEFNVKLSQLREELIEETYKKNVLASEVGRGTCASALSPIVLLLPHQHM
jgi:hypothetical protein